MAPTLITRQSVQSSPVIEQLLSDLNAEIRRSQPNAEDLSKKYASSSTHVIDWKPETSKTPITPLPVPPDTVNTLLRLGDLLNILWESTPNTPLWSEIWEMYQRLKTTLASPVTSHCSQHISVADTRNEVLPASAHIFREEIAIHYPKTSQASNRDYHDSAPSRERARAEADKPSTPPAPAGAAAPHLEVFVRSTSFPSLRLLLRISDTVATVQRHVFERLGVPPKVRTAPGSQSLGPLAPCR